MKKQFITGVLLTAVVAGGFSTFTSCKDSDEDQFNQLYAEQVSLKVTIDQLQNTLSQCQQNCSTNIAALKGLITELQGKPHYDEATIKGWISALIAQEDLANKFSTINNTLTSLSNRLAALENKKDQFTAAQVQDLVALIALKGQIETAITEAGKVAQLSTDLSALSGKVDGISSDFETYKTTTETTLNTINTNITSLQATVGTLSGKVGALEANYNTLAGQVAALETALNGTDGTDGLIAKVDGIATNLSTLQQTVAGHTTTLGELGKWFENIGLTPAEFQEYVKQGAFVKDNKAALEALVALKDKLNGDALDALNEVYGNLAGINDMYNAIFANAEAPEEGWWNYAEVMQNIKDNSAAIAALQNDVDVIVNRLNEMVTSLILQATSNPVFGTFNTPFGLNSMVLMTYYGNLATSLETFPASGVGAECYSRENDDIDWAALTSSSYTLTNPNVIVVTNDEGQAPMGSLLFTVNPGTVNNLDLAGFSLVNSREDVSKVNLTNVVKDDETVLKFGASRAAGNGNGLYRATATVNPDDLDAIKIHIESGLASALKDAVKNRTASDMVTLMKAIYNQIQDVCDANALRYSYNAYTGKDALGQWMQSPQKVYSNYGLAATAFKPLSYATLKGQSLPHLPKFGYIELDKDMVNLDLKPFKIGDVTFSVSLIIDEVKIDPVGATIISVKIPNQYDVNVDRDGQGSATLPENWDTTPGMYDTIQVDISGDLNEVISKIRESFDEWLNGAPDKDKPGLNDQINTAIQNAVDTAFNGEDGFITKIENQVNDMMGNIQDKIDNLFDKINGDYLGKVNRLIDRYNDVADRLNKVLDDPNHYLQSVLLYRKNGRIITGTVGGHKVPTGVELPVAVLSTDPKLPTQFKGDGEAIELFATSYTFETVCPAFKKIVAVTNVTKGNADGTVTACPDLVKAANASLAQVMNGDANRVAVNVKGATNGVYTYEIAYQALDYTGHTSTVKAYFQVVR